MKQLTPHTIHHHLEDSQPSCTVSMQPCFPIKAAEELWPCKISSGHPVTEWAHCDVSWGMCTTISEKETNEQLDQARYGETVLHFH